MIGDGTARLIALVLGDERPAPRPAVMLQRDLWRVALELIREANADMGKEHIDHHGADGGVE